jgi:hypothetical protein
LPFDQRQNLREAIIGKKARIAEIERTLNRPIPTSINGVRVHVSMNNRLRLERQRQELLFTLAEQERELERLVGPYQTTVPPKGVVAAATVDTSNWRAQTSDSPLLKKYRSAIKRAILIQLTQKPDATDLEICRGLDADGGFELPVTWKNRPTNRLFADAYSDARQRNKIQATISKVRRDLRKPGLLSSR